MRLFSITILLALITTAHHGCAAPTRVAADPLGAPPEDFTVDVTILSGGVRPNQPQPGEVHLRQSRIVLFADGSLHYGESGRGADWLPGLTRRLSREQVAHVWTLARQLGLANPDLGEPASNFALENAQAGEVKHLALFTGGDRRWAFTRSAPVDGEHDPAMVEFVRTLAQLAWATDRREETTVALPRRKYDFGPDPYARYRR